MQLPQSLDKADVFGDALATGGHVVVMLAYGLEIGRWMVLMMKRVLGV